jgi:hypothetical protein
MNTMMAAGFSAGRIGVTRATPYPDGVDVGGGIYPRIPTLLRGLRRRDKPVAPKCPYGPYAFRRAGTLSDRLSGGGSPPLVANYSGRRAWCRPGTGTAQGTCLRALVRPSCCAFSHCGMASATSFQPLSMVSEWP